MFDWDNEQWTKLPKHPCHSVSDLGRVRIDRSYNKQHLVGVYMQPKKVIKKDGSSIYFYTVDKSYVAVLGFDVKVPIDHEWYKVIRNHNNEVNNARLIRRRVTKAQKKDEDLLAQFKEINMPGCPWERGLIQASTFGPYAAWDIAAWPEVGLGYVNDAGWEVNYVAI